MNPVMRDDADISVAHQGLQQHVGAVRDVTELTLTKF